MRRALLLLLTLAACEKGPTPQAPAKPRPTSFAEPLAIGPISYFNTQCATCHGQYGVQIADHNIAKQSTPAAYRAMVEYMVTDRAGSSLPSRDLDAQAAYCTSLAAAGNDPDVHTEGAPLFVCTKSPINKGGLEGEVTPGSAVTLIAAKGQVRIAAEVSGHTWTIPPLQVANARQSAGDDWFNATLEARKGSALQTIRLAEEPFKGPRLSPPAAR
ncbi:MAG: hypothetical protein K2Q09_05985 [Phycisphaerales bacterium]|nr:hypothetical protein [Phycisphaerales bacterium]